MNPTAPMCRHGGDWNTCLICRPGLVLEPRQPIYKMVKMPMPHCPVCGQKLGGNASVALPYSCACGVWEADYSGLGFRGFYRIKTNPL